MLYPNVFIFARYAPWLDAASLTAGHMLIWHVGVAAGWWDIDTRTSALAYSLSSLVAFAVVSYRLHSYHGRRTEKAWRELLSLSEVGAIAMGLGYAAATLAVNHLPANLFLATASGSLGIILASRIMLRYALRQLRRHGKDRRWWILVGRNSRTANIVRELLSHPDYGIEIRAVVDFGPGRVILDEADEALLSALPSITPPDCLAFRALLDGQVVDEVVICLPMRSHFDHVAALMDACQDAGVPAKIPPIVFADGHAPAVATSVGTIPMLTHWNGPTDPGRLALKRMIDVVGSLAALLVLLPFGAAIAVAIKLTSPGPVFFTQARLGLHGRPFRIVKFRTMAQNALALQPALREHSVQDGPAFKIHDDPRIFPVGRLLRRYHLDETPQFYNVLKGEMSLVGPRPLAAEESPSGGPWERRRLSVLPGLTCLWQIQSGDRPKFEEWMRLDLEYIDTWSLWLDLRILANTVRVLGRGPGW